MWIMSNIPLGPQTYDEYHTVINMQVGIALARTQLTEFGHNRFALKKEHKYIQSTDYSGCGTKEVSDGLTLDMHTCACSIYSTYKHLHIYTCCKQY